MGIIWIRHACAYQLQGVNDGAERWYYMVSTFIDEIQTTVLLSMPALCVVCGYIGGCAPRATPRRPSPGAPRPPRRARREIAPPGKENTIALPCCVYSHFSLRRLDQCDATQGRRQLDKSHDLDGSVLTVHIGPYLEYPKSPVTVPALGRKSASVHITKPGIRKE